MLPEGLNVKEWADPVWRLENLYWIQDKGGKPIRFKMNDSQRSLLRDLWHMNVILKSRQRGFSTLIQLLALDQAMFIPGFKAGLIAQGLQEAQEIFRTKIKFAYDRMPDAIKQAVFPVTDSKTELELSNGSKVIVGTSMRSGTLQLLHVSEMGKIAAKYPERAREIITGSIPSVHPEYGGKVFIESTAEGRDGFFYEIVKTARDQQDAKTPLTPMDYRLHFYPWVEDPDATMDPRGVTIPAELRDYFETLEAKAGIKLTAGQKAWYAKKFESLGDDMKREFPGTVEEAFDAAVKGAYYARQMTLLRKLGHIRKVDWIPSEVVNTFWDLGKNDLNAIWFHQFIAGEHRFINYYENHNEGLAHYVQHMNSLGYLYGFHYLPHDAVNESLERLESRVDRLVELGVPESKILVVQRIEDINTGIELVRKSLPNCWFDAERCAQGIKHLDNYRRQWDDRNATWMNHPQHNEASNGSDAFRQFSQGWQQPGRVSQAKNRRRRFNGMAA